MQCCYIKSQWIRLNSSIQGIWFSGGGGGPDFYGEFCFWPHAIAVIVCPASWAMEAFIIYFLLFGTIRFKPWSSDLRCFILRASLSFLANKASNRHDVHCATNLTRNTHYGSIETYTTKSPKTIDLRILYSYVFHPIVSHDHSLTDDMCGRASIMIGEDHTKQLT